MKKPLSTLITSSLLSLALAGCGGDSSTNPIIDPPPPTQTGVLTDSPVGGVSYTTSTGFSGTTDANGEFKYNPGETVSFKIGGITLGTIDAAATITPVDLAGADANKVTNLLVLLQSLDADGDPENGITITPATVEAAQAVTSLDLSVAPEQFSNVSNTTLTALLTAAELPPSNLVSPAEAAAHFKSQFFKQLQGVWTLTLPDGVATLQVGALNPQTGKAAYTLAEAGVEEPGIGKSGTEVGALDWDPVTGMLSSSQITHDSNGEWGLSHEVSLKARFNGEQLILGEGEDSVTLTRAQNDTTSLVGTWTLDGFEHMINFTFFANGTYLMADALGDTDVDPQEGSCGGPGAEYGQYSVSGSQLSVSIAQANMAHYNTNGCAGLWESAEFSSEPIVLTLAADGSTATLLFHGEDQPVEIRRIAN